MNSIQMADWKVTKYQKRLIREVLDSGRLTYGPMTRDLEEQFSKLHNRKYALFTSSGTAALKIALGALKDKYGWQDGDEVIIPSVTFVATLNAVVMNNLTPVLVDIDVDTVNINPNKIEPAITDKTRAIIPVHLLGQPCDMRQILKLAKQYDLKIVEDSCETMFVSKDGKVVGSQGDIACFSSYIAHLMVTGVGGFITTNNKELSTVMRSMMFHGRDESYLNIDDNLKTGKEFTEMVKKRFHFPRFGYSDRMTELEACLGLGDLHNWQAIIRKRQYNAVYLMDRLKGLPMTFPVTDPTEHAFMFFPMLVAKRDGLVEHLEKNEIHTRHMMPLISQPIVKPYVTTPLPAAESIGRRGILLPVHQYLTYKDLDEIVKQIRSFYA